MTGFVVFDYEKSYDVARREIESWIIQKKLISREQVEPGGVQMFLPTLMKLFTGDNVGKLILQIDEDSTTTPKAKL